MFISAFFRQGPKLEMEANAKECHRKKINRLSVEAHQHPLTASNFREKYFGRNE